jgi:hypothetical protein
VAAAAAAAAARQQGKNKTGVDLMPRDVLADEHLGLVSWGVQGCCLGREHVTCLGHSDGCCSTPALFMSFLCI